MAYLLEFPPSTPPNDIRKPPYVIFGINGNKAIELPPRIPLNLVLHFASKLAQWVLPLPDNLPPAVAQGVLRTPHVGIDIHLDIGPASLQRIILKMMQAGGFVVPKNKFLHAPSLITSMSICKTWRLLELPSAGLDGLLIHIQAHLMTGPPVTLTEIRTFWDHFPADHIILGLAANNLIQAQIEWHYSREEFSPIRHWYLSTKERYHVFKAAEDQFPEFGKQLQAGFRKFEHVDSEDVESRRKAREQQEQGEARMNELEAKKAEAKKTKAKASRKSSADSLESTRNSEDLKIAVMHRYEALNAEDAANAKTAKDLLKEKAKGMTTIRRSTKIKVKPTGDKKDGSETIEMGIMSSLLDVALKKVQEERDAKDEESEDDKKESELSTEMSELSMEMKAEKEEHEELQDDNEIWHDAEDKNTKDTKEAEVLEVLQPAAYNPATQPA